ncbi:MAG TPA: NAD(P)-binding domain-containing protein [Micromonosporaceae bacterium]
MPRTDTVIIGAGHAGLALSRCLTDRGVDHVVLERGCVGERWRTARWDSFQMLTPNWLSRLPDWRYPGTDSDGFMTAPEFVQYLSGYARSFDAPVETGTLVTRVQRAAAGFAVDTDRGLWRARNVVVATGYHSEAKVPGLAARLAHDLTQIPSSRYRSPASVPAGAVLVVGASASGVQIAHELAAAGRPVLLAVGCHTRLPRRYRGHDILWWLDRTGRLDRTIDQMPDAGAALAEPASNWSAPPTRAASTSVCWRRAAYGSPAACAISAAPWPTSPTIWPTRAVPRSDDSTRSSARSTATRQACRARWRSRRRTRRRRSPCRRHRREWTFGRPGYRRWSGRPGTSRAIRG